MYPPATTAEYFDQSLTWKILENIDTIRDKSKYSKPTDYNRVMLSIIRLVRTGVSLGRGRRSSDCSGGLIVARPSHRPDELVRRLLQWPARVDSAILSNPAGLIRPIADAGLSVRRDIRRGRTPRPSRDRRIGGPGREVARSRAVPTSSRPARGGNVRTGSMSNSGTRS